MAVSIHQLRTAVQSNKAVVLNVVMGLTEEDMRFTKRVASMVDERTKARTDEGHHLHCVGESVSPCDCSLILSVCSYWLCVCVESHVHFEMLSMLC